MYKAKYCNFDNNFQIEKELQYYAGLNFFQNVIKIISRTLNWSFDSDTYLIIGYPGLLVLDKEFYFIEYVRVLR